jgi:hypothetical protein
MISKHDPCASTSETLGKETKGMVAFYEIFEKALRIVNAMLQN